MNEDQTKRFEDHLREDDKVHNDILIELRTIRSGLDNRVTYQSFTWILGILVTILISVTLYIANQIKDIQSTTNQTQNVVSQIKGKLDPYNIEFKP